MTRNYIRGTKLYPGYVTIKYSGDDMTKYIGDKYIYIHILMEATRKYIGDKYIYIYINGGVKSYLRGISLAKP